MAPPDPSLSMQTPFADLPDPRIDRTRRHDRLDIVVIALCAVLSGADGWVDIANYGVAKYDWLKTFLRLPAGIPSHDTSRRVSCWLDPSAFLECFQRWIDALRAGLGLKRIASTKRLSGSKM